MREFAETEIIIPDGPFEGRRYSCDRQPYSRLWFDAVGHPYWRRFVATGPTQSGKSLTCFIIPTLYHLFEVGETVICGLPSLDMAADKWNEDLLPVIERSKYRDLLPRAGAGSKGGSSNLLRVVFNNGATLRFMSGGGDDKARAGFTSRVLVVTETDGLDAAGKTSREADKLTQLEGRTRAYNERARIYMECTVSIEAGRTWQEYTKGTQSKIALRCPHCAEWVTPEREHLVGWQDAADILEAGNKASFVCPSCGQLWNEQDRVTANANSLLVHKGQKVEKDGTIVGEMPQTDTLGFRWTATNNLLARTSAIGKDEWKASRSANEDNAEREMRQFVWALPHQPSAVDLTVLDHTAIMRRTEKECPKGYCPPDTSQVTVGIDVGKWLCHWVAVAWRPNATPHVIEHGRIEVASDSTSEEVALLTALREFRDTTLKDGWESARGKIGPSTVFIDARYLKEAVYAFVEESGQPFFATMGFSSTQKDGKKFIRRGRDSCVGIGEEYQVIKRPGGGFLIEINADHWKGWLHTRVQTPIGQPGALTLFRSADGNEHLSYAKHLTAEKKIEDFEPGKGTVIRWQCLSRNNHWLDATSLACVAAHASGVRLMGDESQPQQGTKTTGETQDNWVNSYRRYS